MDLKDVVGQRIRELRTAAGLSQMQLAESTGLNRVFLGSLERGEHSATVETLEKLSKGLGVRPWELLRVDEDEEAGKSRLDGLLRTIRALAHGCSDHELDWLGDLARSFLKGLKNHGRQPQGGND